MFHSSRLDFWILGAVMRGRSVRINSIIRISDRYDLKVAGEKLNVSMKEVNNNYCYTAVIPANSSEFDFFHFQDRR